MSLTAPRASEQHDTHGAASKLADLGYFSAFYGRQQHLAQIGIITGFRGGEGDENQLTTFATTDRLNNYMNTKEWAK